MSNNLPIPATITRIRPMSADTTLFTLSCNGKDNPPGVTSFFPGQFLV